MPLYGNIFRANFFDLKNSTNRQINGDLEHLIGFGISFFGSYHPLLYLNIPRQGGDHWKPPKNLV